MVGNNIRGNISTDDKIVYIVAMAEHMMLTRSLQPTADHDISHPRVASLLQWSGRNDFIADLLGGRERQYGVRRQSKTRCVCVG